MMMKEIILLIPFLLSSHVISVGQSLKCDNTTEYERNGWCCKKCEPGQRMKLECGSSPQNTQCYSCENGYFTNSYNLNYKRCDRCTLCTGEHMKYEKECTITSDAVCTCDEGYRCSKSKCDMCVKIPTTTATPALTRPPPPPTTDNVWISVSLCFACVCVCVLFTCFLLTSRHAQTCGWIMSASAGFWSTEKNNSRASQCTEEEEVPMPVQEVCGIEKLEDV